MADARRYLAQEIEDELARRLKPLADSRHWKYRRERKSGHVFLEMTGGRVLEFNVGFATAQARDQETAWDRFSVVVSDRPSKTATGVRGQVLGTIGKDDLVADRLRDLLGSYFTAKSL
jgi:hypothetical protein